MRGYILDAVLAELLDIRDLRWNAERDKPRVDPRFDGAGHFLPAALRVVDSIADLIGNAIGNECLCRLDTARPLAEPGLGQFEGFLKN